MTSAATPHRRTGRHVRDRQRVVHLLTALALLAYIYAAPLLGTGVTITVQWVVVPALVVSGLAMWKWPRLRAQLRRRRG